MKYFKLINGQTYHINDFDEQIEKDHTIKMGGDMRYVLPVKHQFNLLVEKIILLKINLENFMPLIQKLLLRDSHMTKTEKEIA
ncbi:hypothetical protein [Streptococcus equinus]|uniref:hypothetical protein n=1 Tax=Streptococcus equinus TaxID=1335 RepID=UPI003BF8AD9B